MSEKLAKLGAFAFRKRWLVLASWLAIVVIAGTLMSVFRQPVSDSFSIPGTESQEAFDKLEELMPAAANGSGRIVFAAPEGEELIDYQATIDATLAKVADLEDVTGTVSPFMTQAISPDGRIGLAQVSLDGTAMDVSETLADDISTALETARDDGLQAEAGGDIASPAPSEGIMGAGEIVGVVIAGITLAITFGALVAASMPLVTAFVGVGIGVSGIYALSGVVDVNTVTPTLAIMLGLAVGIDYSLFIVTRYRKYRMDGLEAGAAVSKSIATAGNAVIFAALTVVIALAGLSIVGIPFLTTMGLAAAGTVAVAATVAVTLIPALLGFGGDKVLSKKQRAQLAAGKTNATSTDSNIAKKYVTAISKKPLLVVVLVVLLVGAIAAPATKLHLGFPTDASAPVESTERKAYDLIDEGFGPGFNGPLLIVAELPDDLSASETQQRVGEIAERLGEFRAIAAVQPAGMSEAGDLAILQAIPITGPSDEGTKNLVTNLRDQADEIAGEGANLYVTGTTAITLDMDNLLADALPKYLLVVVGLSLILLMIVFRSILVPLKATLGFLLTIAATFGALVVMFQWGWFGVFDPTPIVSFLPIIMVGILFGLAMDYEFFLVSGMHEAYEHEDKGKAKAAVINGFTHGASVVTAAAVIMISVFAGFIFTDMQMVQMIGFALAFGILIDAFVVRMTLVPAAMFLFGKAAWWLPAWLKRILPNVSLEGDEAAAETVISAKKPAKQAK